MRTPRARRACARAARRARRADRPRPRRWLAGGCRRWTQQREKECGADGPIDRRRPERRARELRALGDADGTEEHAGGDADGETAPSPGGPSRSPAGEIEREQRIAATGVAARQAVPGAL